MAIKKTIMMKIEKVKGTKGCAIKRKFKFKDYKK